jgi:hypothetical protein
LAALGFLPHARRTVVVTVDVRIAAEVVFEGGPLRTGRADSGRRERLLKLVVLGAVGPPVVE